MYKFLLIASILFSQDRILTLNDCIEMAKTQSPEAKIARSEFESKHLKYESYKSSLQPQIFLSGQIPQLTKSISEFSTLGPDSTLQKVFVNQNQSNSRIGLSVSKSIPWTGGSIYTSSNLTRQDDFSNEHIVSWQSSPLSFGYTQPLFSFNDLRWSNLIEDRQMDLARQELLEKIENNVTDITNLFFSLYISGIQLENAKFNVEVNDSIYAISQGRYTVGKIAENDLLRSELATMNSKNALEKNQLNYERDYETLKLALGLEDDFQVTLPASLPEFEIDLDFVLQQARQNRSQYISYNIQEINALKNLNKAQKERWLSANINASVGYNQTASKFEDLYKEPLKTESYTLSFEFPLSQRSKKLSYMKSREDLERTRKSIAREKQKSEQQLEYQLREFLLLEKQLHIAARSDTIAVKQFNVAKDRYLIGKIDISTLFLAQNDMDNTHRQYYQTLKDYWVAYYRLRQLTLYDFEKREKISY